MGKTGLLGQGRYSAEHVTGASACQTSLARALEGPTAPKTPWPWGSLQFFAPVTERPRRVRCSTLGGYLASLAYRADPRALPVSAHAIPDTPRSPRGVFAPLWLCDVGRGRHAHDLPQNGVSAATSR